MQFRAIYLLMAIVLGATGLFGQPRYNLEKLNTDSLLSVLDGIVDGKEPIEVAKQQSIAMSKIRLDEAMGDKALFDAYGEMFYQYRKYRLDSALYYARCRVEVAKRIGEMDSISVALMNVADGLKGLGQFDAGIDILKKLPHDEFVKNSNYYYYLLHSITLSRFNENHDEDMTGYYLNQLRAYRDSISMVNIEGSPGYIINESEIYLSEGRYDDALKILIDFMNDNPELIADNAIFWCTLADIYHLFGNMKAEIYCLTMGAIIDKRNSVKTYTSLQDLALMLNDEGDTDRAYKYITCAIEDIMNSNARSRLLQVAKYMPIILDAYEQVQEDERNARIFYYIIVSILVIILVVILLVLSKRNRKLIEVRRKLDAKNKELVSLNEDLKDVNGRLGESNKIKETYIAQLFNICSGYIDDMEKFRVSLSRKVKTGQMADIKAAVSSPVTTDALKDFFKKFDVIFLDLFPTFVEDFNKLMQPGSEIIPKEGECLTPELRIYALVRLGINDSTKIASFLHYSSQTVYNYRMKVRNKAVVPKDKFVKAVQNL